MYQIEELPDLKVAWHESYKCLNEPLLEYVWEVANHFLPDYAETDMGMIPVESSAPAIFANRYAERNLSVEERYERSKEMKTFKGRVVSAGKVTAEALVSHGGLNTLASFQKALQFGDKKATCGDQNNPDLYGKQMLGKALCLPQTIGSTTGGLVLYCACAMGRQPACLLFSEPIDSLAAAGAILSDVWLEGNPLPVVDSLGDEFLSYVKDGMKITMSEDGTVTVD